MKLHYYLLTSLLLTSCFEYNPNQIILDDDESNLTEKNIAKIKSMPVPDTINFVFMGDTQRFYDESVEFVDAVNKEKDLSFVIHGGDISDFGISREFIWINDILSKISVPYLTVIGNHDLLANGSKVYNEMYGKLNYTFEYGNYKFILINTNSREYGFDGNVPNLNWLASELSNNLDNKNVIVISHIPPFDGDFDTNLENEYAQLLANDPNVVVSLHAHRHSYYDGEYYNDGLRYFITTSMQKKGYARLKLWDNGYELKQVDY